MAVNPIKVWNGTAWEYTGPVVAAPPVKYQATAPTSPATGDVWVESDYDVASVDPSKLLTGGVYTNESTRSAAIPTPTTGMVTYVGDTGTDPSTIPQIQAYTGSAWQTPYGLTLLAKADFTTAASVTIDNVFTSAYANYQVVVALTSANANDQQLRVVFRAATVEPANNYYSALTYRSWTAGTTSVTSNNNSSYGWIGGDSATHASSTFVVCNPNTTNRTTWQGVGVGANGTSGGGGVQADNTAFDGIKITSAASQISGTVRVYGLRNS
jgi:hypothetical protein